MITVSIMGKCSACGRDGLGDNPEFEMLSTGETISKYCTICINPIKCHKCDSDKIVTCPARCGHYWCPCCDYSHFQVRECRG